MLIKGLCFENCILFWIMRSENIENIAEPLLLYLHFFQYVGIAIESKHTGDVIDNGRYKAFFVKRKEGVGGVGEALFFLLWWDKGEGSNTALQVRSPRHRTKAEVKGRASEEYTTISCSNLHIALLKCLSFGHDGFNGQGTTMNEWIMENRITWKIGAGINLRSDYFKAFMEVWQILKGYQRESQPLVILLLILFFFSWSFSNSHCWRLNCGLDGLVIQIPGASPDCMWLI